MSVPNDDRPSRERIMLASPESRRAEQMFLCVLFTLFVISTAFTKFNPLDALLAQGEFWNFIFTDFIPPRIQRLGALFTAVKQTLYMAIGATGISAVLSLILGFLGTPAICRWRLVGALVRGFASLLRNIPVLVWAFILVAAFGIGAAVGIVSLVISTVGELTRYFIETLDEIAGENIEALEATGAGMPQVITQAILPAAIPSFIAWFLYCLELNIRASTILGMVGAGGIGLLMTGYIKQYNYGAASTAIMAVAAIIIGANLLTDYLRRVIL